MPTNEQRRQAAKRKLDRQLARRAERAKRRRTYAVAGSAAAVLLVVGLVVLITTLGGGDDAVDTAAAPSSAPPTSAAPSSAAPAALEIPTERAPDPARAEPLPPTVDCQYPTSGRPPAKPVMPPEPGPIPTEGTVQVTLQTSAGTVPLTLDRSLAPCAVKSFLSLAEQDYFDATPCHRLTTGERLQVLQCGDPSGAGTGGPGYSFADETFSEIEYGRGYLAMANSGPDTNGSQFFVVYGDAQLPPDYTVFGTVSDEGLQVVDEVARAGVQGGGMDGAPAAPVQIEDAVIEG